MNKKFRNSFIFALKPIQFILKLLLKPFGFTLARESSLIDYILYEYDSYEHYKEIQTYHNKRKLDNVWADERTLNRAANFLLTEFKDNSKICGICHGTRNGFELNYLSNFSDKFEVIGTDLSTTASDFPNTFEWDFHNVKDEWVNSSEFVYSNSLDHAWKPKIALQTWLAQLKANGILIIEHTRVHGPEAASEMDPFGVRPTLVPYVLTLWFGSQITIEHTVDKKSNKDLDAWLFFIKKNTQSIKLLETGALKLD